MDEEIAEENPKGEKPDKLLKLTRQQIHAIKIWQDSCEAIQIALQTLIMVYEEDDFEDEEDNEDEEGVEAPTASNPKTAHSTTVDADHF